MDKKRIMNLTVMKIKEVRKGEKYQTEKLFNNCEMNFLPPVNMKETNMETNKLKKPSLRFICQIVIIVCGGLGLIGMDSQNKLDILIVEILGSFVGCLLLYLYFKLSKSSDIKQKIRLILDQEFKFLMFVVSLYFWPF